MRLSLVACATALCLAQATGDDIPSSVVRNTGAFTYKGSAIFTYSTIAQGDGLLTSLLNLFQNTYADSYGLSGATITPTKVKPAANGAKRIFYTITGQASKSIDVFPIIGNFQSLIARGNVLGVAVEPPTFSFEDKAVFDIAGFSIEHRVDSFFRETTATSTLGFHIDHDDSFSREDFATSSSFSVADKSLFTYTTISQRDSLLEQIRLLAVDIFASVGLSNLQIALLGEAPNFGRATQVLYRFIATANSGPAIDISASLEKLHASIESGKIPGVTNIVFNFGGDISGGINGIISGGHPADLFGRR